MSGIPLAVSNYLNTIPAPDRAFAYVQLDQKNRIVASGGELGRCGISVLVDSMPVDQQITQVIGILPVNSLPVVLLNTQTESNIFIDIHIFKQDQFQWILLLDNTESGRKLQAEQQIRLANDIIQGYESK